MCTEKKGKPRFTLQPVPANENAPGMLVRALSACWGLNLSKVNLLGWTTQKVVQPQPIPGGLELAQDEWEAQPEDTSLDHSDISGGDWCGDNPGQLGEPSGDQSRSLDQPKRTGSDWPSRGGPEDQGLSYEMVDPCQATELKEDSPAVPGTNWDSTKSRLSERGSTNKPSTKRTSLGPQASKRSSTSVSNVPSTEEPEVGSKSSEGTWRQVWTQGSRNRLDDSEVKRDLLKGNSDSESRGHPSRYFWDWFNSKDNKGENDLNSNELMNWRRTKNSGNPLKWEARKGTQRNMSSTGVNDWSSLLGSGTL